MSVTCCQISALDFHQLYWGRAIGSHKIVMSRNLVNIVYYAASLSSVSGMQPRTRNPEGSIESLNFSGDSQWSDERNMTFWYFQTFWKRIRNTTEESSKSLWSLWHECMILRSRILFSALVKWACKPSALIASSDSWSKLVNSTSVTSHRRSPQKNRRSPCIFLCGFSCVTYCPSSHTNTHIVTNTNCHTCHVSQSGIVVRPSACTAPCHHHDTGYPRTIFCPRRQDVQSWPSRPWPAWWARMEVRKGHSRIPMSFFNIPFGRWPFFFGAARHEDGGTVLSDMKTGFAVRVW
jgi:hypothetical protein